MRTFLFILIANFVSGQTKQESVEFLKEYVNDWSIETFAEGTFNRRLEFKIEEPYLVIREYFPSSSFAEYGIIKIYMNKITRVELQNEYNIVIYTEPNGFKLLSKSKNSGIEEEMNAENYAAAMGWKYDSIKLKANIDRPKRAERIIKAIEFLAVDSGAALKESAF